MIVMAKGEQKSFGHHLLSLLWPSAETMKHPRLRNTRALLAQEHHITTNLQQFIVCLDTMEHKRLMHLLCQ
jgi:hypothetical protein